MRGSWVWKIVLPCQLICALLAATVSHAAAASRPVGGINAEPSMRPNVYAGPNPDGWWCQPPNCHQSADPRATINQELSLAAHLHVADVRLEFPWALMQPQSNQFDWSRSDFIVAAARAHHVTLQPVLMWTPSWESSNPSQVTSAGDFGSFVAVFTARYDHAFPVIEMWNEPDGGAYGSYTHGREQVYVETILNPGYAAVKSVDPSIDVELGGSINDSGGCCPFLSAVLADGGKFDIASFHNYVGAPDAITEAGAYRVILDRAGRSAIPVWLGEYGVPDANADDTAHQQLMQSILGTSSDLAMAQWYNLRDDFAMSCCPPVVVATGTWGLVQHDDCAVNVGYATMARLLGGDSGPPSCPPSQVTTAVPSGAGPAGSAIAASHGAPAVLAWAVAAAVLAGVAAVLAGIRHRARLKRRARPGAQGDEGW